MQNINRKIRNHGSGYKSLFFLAIILSALIKLYPESPIADFNTYYQFPFSLGLEYQSYTYFNHLQENSKLMGLTVHTRCPLPAFPQLQPSLELGFIYVDYLDPLYPQKWDHTQYYALLGLVYANRLLKNFEFGLEVLGGAAYVTFPNLIQKAQGQSSVNLLGQAGLHISLVPNYNFMLTFHPTLKYFYSLTPLTNFNGLVMGIGLALHYRIGDDPDRPHALLNSLTYSNVVLPAVYANMQHYYTNHPIGKAVITNSEKFAVRDLEVYFSQATYLDAKTYCGTKAELGPGKSWEAELFATLNDQVFNLEGSAPINGEIIITYKALGRSGEQRKSVTFELNDKTTIIWDDYAKVAALITPADSALKNYSSFVQRQCETETLSEFNRNLQLAMQLFHALTELNIIYQPDPALPFSTIKAAADAVKDTVYLARDTLIRGSGDCDDLTVLFCSLLESVGIESGFMIVPGHIFPVFNTKEKARSFANLHPDREMSIQYNGELWLPVELTLLGKSNFSGAWCRGIEQYLANKENGGFHTTQKAWEKYKPVGLKEKDLGLQYGNLEKIKKGFKEDLTQITNQVVAGYLKSAREKKDKTVYNILGTLYASFGKLPEAEKAFLKALEYDKNYLYARINLAILFVRKKEYQRALSSLKECKEQFELVHNYPPLVLSKIYAYLSQCHKALGEENYALEFAELSYEIEAKFFTGKEERLNQENNSVYHFLLEQNY
jgi:hypothetical protein